MQLTQLRTALSPACSGLSAQGSILVRVTEPQSYLARGPGSALPSPRPPTGSTIKGLSCSAPLTRGLKSRGDHELHQHPAAGEDLGLGGGGWAVLWTPRDRLSRTRESGSCFVWPEEV